uniref:5-hydroxytryptamine (serotonin) receptor 3A n=1 Tax=Echeneis naucrates TaxID=173247 RepID=A0A665X4H3_ECHNA
MVPGSFFVFLSGSLQGLNSAAEFIVGPNLQRLQCSWPASDCYYPLTAPPSVSLCLSRLSCKEGHSGPTHESVQAVFDLRPFRPAVNLSNPTVTNISFTLYAVLGVRKGLIVFSPQYWNHEFLVWDPDECDGVSRISLPVKELWSPDIIVYDVDDDVSQACPYVYVNHTGHIRWDRMLRLVSACNLKIFSFPFDVQNCTFTFGSYMHTSETRTPKYDRIIERCRSFLMLIDILSFYLPPHSVDRASFKMTLILGYTVFLLIMNDLLPSTANGTPIIGIYFSVCLALMVISLLETVIITNVLHHSSMKYQEIPGWVRVVILKHIANLICYSWPEDVRPPSALQKGRPGGSSSPQAVQPGDETQSQHPASRGTEHSCFKSELQEQWCHVGYILDFLLFRIYLLLITCYALVIICMWCIWISQT